MIKIKEIWKDIVGYEGLYRVSSLGRVMSLPKIRCSKNRGGKYICYLPQKILKPIITVTGYLEIELTKNKKAKRFKIHRLVAQMFIPNPNNYPCINHKDENKKNNNVDNLEWCTISYNNSYGNRLKKFSKPIYQYDMNNNLIKRWDCMYQIEKEMKYYHSMLLKCCRGEIKSAYGYKWQYVNNK